MTIRFQISDIAHNTVKGFRSVHLRTSKRRENGGMGVATFGVWVPEAITDIDEIKKEAVKLAGDFATEISSSEEMTIMDEDRK